MSRKTLRLDDTMVNEKEFRTSKQAFCLNLVDIVISDKFKCSDTGFKNIIGYKDDNISRPLCIILPQMSGFIKYFDNGGKNISLMITYWKNIVKFGIILKKLKV